MTLVPDLRDGGRRTGFTTNGYRSQVTKEMFLFMTIQEHDAIFNQTTECIHPYIHTYVVKFAYA
jgi:hypothetical protein